MMWEASETVLHHVKGDVLVIFDCCDAGSLAKLRSAGRAFEYLGACDSEKYTHPPGVNSFTSALTWALKELSSEPPFTTDRLVSKVKDYERFPRKQKPVLFARRNYMPEHIWISRIRTLATPTLSRRRQSSSIPEFRDENCDYVDFRVTFNRPLSDEDGKAVADLMGPLVSTRNLPLSARHVSFMGKGTCKPSGNPSAHWTRVRNHLVACQRFQGLVDSTGTMPNRKRKRGTEDQKEDPSWTAFSKCPLELDIDRAIQLPTTSSGEDHDSGSDATIGLRIDTTIRPTPRILQSPYETESDSLKRTTTLLKDLEKLKEDILHQPEVHRYLQSQIRAVLTEDIR